MTPTPIPTAGSLVLVHSDEYANWVFDAQHPTQGRRFMKARERLLELAPAGRCHGPRGRVRAAARAGDPRAGPRS